MQHCALWDTTHNISMCVYMTKVNKQVIKKIALKKARNLFELMGLISQTSVV